MDVVSLEINRGHLKIISYISVFKF